MRKKMKGSVTVEAAFLVPIILSMLVVVITMIFYFHDKIIIKGVAHETIVVSSGWGDVSEEDVETYFAEQLGQRLLIFSYVQTEAEIERDEIRLACKAQSHGMRVHFQAKMKRTDPETWIRRVENITGE